MSDHHALDENVSELATQVGADMRVVEAKTSAWVALTMFGDAGAGGDDSAIFQSAVDALPNTGGRITVPPGTYRVRDIVVGKPVIFDCQTGSAQNTAAAAGTTATAVSFRYSGTGGVGSRMFTFKASVAGQWIKGGGIVGRPHLSGENRCEVLIDGQSLHGCEFDVELSRATGAGMSLNAQNGALSQFNKIDFKYVYGAQQVAEGSHGLIMNGNNPAWRPDQPDPADPSPFLGCTQNRIWTGGMVHDGEMIRMVGHCDNNHIWAHATQGLGPAKGEGNTLGAHLGNANYGARINHIHYICGSVFLQAGTFGTHFDFITSEGMTIRGGGQYSYDAFLDYITGKVYTSLKAPGTLLKFVSAAEMVATGAAAKGVIATGGIPVVTLPAAGIGGVAFSLHDPVWGAGTLAHIEFVFRASAGAGNVLLQTDFTSARAGEALTVDSTVTDAVAVDGANVQTYRHGYAIAVPAKQLAAFHIQRLPANVLDTMTGDLHLLGVNVRIDFNGPASLTAPLAPWKEDKNA